MLKFATKAFFLVSFLFKEFSVGCFCAERGSLYHDLHQHHFHLTQSCKEKVAKPAVMLIVAISLI